jgi:hypothetical protein
MSNIVAEKQLGFPWETVDPFLFCVHHDDAYPAGNDQLGPAASLAGRELGQDFGRKDGWSMYQRTALRAVLSRSYTSPCGGSVGVILCRHGVTSPRSVDGTFRSGAW